MFHENNKPKIVFLGTPEFALPSLEALIKNDLAPALVVTQPDRKIGRKQNFVPPPVKEMALANSLKVIQPKNKKKLAEILSSQFFDVAILVAYGMIIPDEIINKPKYGFLNLHPSLLPKYRGSSPIQTSLLDGEEKTGISIIKLSKAVDAGPIVAQKEVKILPTDNAQTLHDKLAKAGAELLVKILADYFADKIKLSIQDESKATFTKIINREDGQINWQNNAQQIFCQFRAFFPWPGVFTYLAGKRLKIVNLSVIGGNFGANLSTGEVFLGLDGELLVKCGQGAIKLENVQLEGKKELPGKEFLRGQKDLLGQVLK